MAKGPEAFSYWESLAPDNSPIDTSVVDMLKVRIEGGPSSKTISVLESLVFSGK